MGPLAKVDWSGFLRVEFLGPMELLELRGEVAAWFAKGFESEYNEHEYDERAGGNNSRIRCWASYSLIDMSVFVAADGTPEKGVTTIWNGPQRRNSFHNGESLELPASLKRKRSI